MNPILSLPGRIPSLSKPQVDRFSLVFHCGRFLSTRVQEGGLLQSRAPAGAATRAAGAGGALGTLRPGPLQRPSKGLLRLLRVPKQGRRLYTKPMLGSMPVCPRRQVEPHHSLANSFVRERQWLNSGENAGLWISQGVRRFLPEFALLFLCLNQNYKIKLVDQDH